MSEHAKEPWRLELSSYRDPTDEHIPVLTVYDADDRVVICLDQYSDVERETMRRIVACVNACRGLSTRDLEDSGRGLASFVIADVVGR